MFSSLCTSKIFIVCTRIMLDTVATAMLLLILRKWEVGAPASCVVGTLLIAISKGGLRPPITEGL